MALFRTQRRLLTSAFKTYLRESEDIIFIKDANLVYVASSLPFARLTGIKEPTEDSVAGKTDFELF